MADVDDDDFGELYADVEAQALTAVNDGRSVTQLIHNQQATESTAIDHPAPDDPAPTAVASQMLEESEGSQKLREGAEAVSALRDNADMMKEVVEDESDGTEEKESDSEDDFNILLNENDGSPLGPRCDGYFQMRGYGEESDGKANDIVGNEGEHFAGNCIRDNSGGLGSNQYIKGHGFGSHSNPKCHGNQKNAHWDDVGYIRHNGSRSCNASISSLIDSGYCFSRPWYRTILDINVDALENKPWRNPGADITDFFNFGFNEEGWNGYCQKLYELRKQMAIARASPVSEDAGFKQSIETGVGHRFQRPVHEKIFPIGSAGAAWQMSKYAGNQQWDRIVQVEDGNQERPSSMDVRRPRDQDSDVVIEIIAQEGKEHSSCSDKERNIVKDDILPGVPKTACAGADDREEVQTSGSMSADDASACFVKGEDQRSLMPSVKSNRQYVSESARSPTVLGPDRKRGERCTELNAASEEYCRAAGERNVSEGDSDKSTSETNPCLMKLDLSLDDNNGCISSPSAESESEGSMYDDACAHKETRKGRGGSLASSLEKLDQTAESDYSFSRHHDRDDIGLKAHISRYSPGDRSPVGGEWKHYYKNHLLHDKWKIWNGGRGGIDAADCKPRKNYLQKQHHLTSGRHKRNEHVHCLASSDEDLPYDGEAEYFRCSDDKRGLGNRNQVDHLRDSHRRTRQIIRNDIDPYFRREVNRRDYVRRGLNHHMVDEIGRRDGHHREGKFLRNEDLSPTLQYGHSSKEGKLNSWMRYDGMQFNRRQKVDSLLASRYADDLFFDKVEGDDPSYGNEVDYIGRKHGQLSPRSGRDDVYWIRKESTYVNPEYTDRRHDVLRRTRGTNDSRLIRRDGRHNRNLFTEGHRDGCFQGSDDAFDSYSAMKCHDMELYVEESYDLQLRAFDLRESDFVRTKPDELYDKDISFDSGPRSECDTGRPRLQHRTISNRQIMKHKSRIMRCSHELHGVNSGALSRGKHEVSGFRNRDSDGLHSVVSERKSFGDSSKAQTSACNDLRDTLRRRNQKLGKHLSDEFRPKGVARTDNSQTERLPIRRGADGSDLEEGQIPAGKGNHRTVQKNHPLKRKPVQDGNSNDVTNKDGVYNESWILEAKTKMEKRRERFKEPVCDKKESDSCVKSSDDKLVETDQQNLQRPRRKRRWVGS